MFQNLEFNVRLQLELVYWMRNSHYWRLLKHLSSNIIIMVVLLLSIFASPRLMTFGAKYYWRMFYKCNVVSASSFNIFIAICLKYFKTLCNVSFSFCKSTINKHNNMLTEKINIIKLIILPRIKDSRNKQNNAMSSLSLYVITSVNDISKMHSSAILWYH